MSKQTMDTASQAAAAYVEGHLGKKDEVGSLLQDGSNNSIPEYFAAKIATQQSAVNDELKALAKGSYNISDTQARLTQFIDQINTFTDLKCGTIRTRVEAKDGIAFVGNDPEKEKSPVMLRDSRLQSSYKDKVAKPEEVAEQTIALAAANIRGVLQIIKDSPRGKKDEAAKMALEVFTHYAPLMQQARTQSERNDVVAQMNGKLCKILKSPSYELSMKGKHDMPELLSAQSDSKIRKGIGLVRDLTNLQDVGRHTSQITISSPINRGDNYSVEALIPVNPVSTKLKEHYTDPAKRQKWSKALHPMLRNSVLNSEDKFCDKMADGRHIISSQIKVPGLQNAYQHNVDIVGKEDGKTITMEGGKKASISVLRVAAPAHNEGKASSLINKIKHFGNKKARQLESEITAQNQSHLTDIAGKAVKNVILVQTADPKEHIGQGLDEGMKKRDASKGVGVEGGGHKYSVKEAPISVSANKWHHLDNIPVIYDATLKDNEVLVVSCAKAKDRTAAAIAMLTARQLKDNNTVGFESDLRIVSQAQSGAAASAGPGATDGIFGTKASNVLNKLKLFGGKNNPLLKVKDLITSKLCNLNHLESKQDLVYEMPIEKQDRALNQAQTMRQKFSQFLGRGTAPPPHQPSQKPERGL